MAFPDDPRDLEVGFAFGSPASADPTGLTYEVVAPGPTDDDPGDVLGAVTITRGRVGNDPATGPTRIETALRNADGQYSPRNVTGDHYGDLRKGTPKQVRVDAGSGMVVRGRAAQPDWNPRRDGPDINQRVPVEALGVLSRVGRIKVDQSAIRRAVMASSPRAYWPLEDGFDATVAGSAVSNVAPLSTVGTITFAQDNDLPGSASTPDMSSGALLGTVPPGGSSTAWYVEFWIKASYNTGSRAAYLLTSSTSVATWGIRQPSSASGNIDIIIFDSNGSSAGTAIGPVTGWAEDVWHHIAIVAEQNGSNVDVSVYGDGDLLAVNIVSSVTLGRITAVAMNDFEAFDFADLLSCAHIAVGDGDTPSDSALAGDAYTGEIAADRIRRLCDEEGIPRFVPFPAIDSPPMGPQQPGALLSLLRECEAADHGILYERTDGRLAYKQLNTLYNLSVTMELDYGTESVPGNCNVYPIDDDRDLYNIVTVTRRDGASATAEQVDGPVGTDETEGVGPRSLPVTLNLETDSQVVDHANWLKHETTIDQPRFVVTVDLRATPDLISNWLACDIGSRITVANPPAEDCGPDDLDLIIVGYVETLGATVWAATLYCEPYARYKIAVVEDPADEEDTPRVGSETAELALGVDDDDLSFSVTVGADGDWTTDAADFPMVAEVGGEQVLLSAISGSGTQTFTVSQRSVNGITKSHSAGALIKPLGPLIVGL